MAVVYQHRRLDTNEVFYIGIGLNKNRAYSKSGRNKHWHNIVNKIGYDVDILIDGCNMSQAKYIEASMISQLGQVCFNTGPLVNITKGGDDTETNKNRVCVNKNDKESFISPNKLNEYINNGWNKGRSNKTRVAIGKANSISQLGKKHPKEVIEKMKGPRKPYKVDDYKKDKIITLYKNNTRISDICSIINLSYPIILSVLKNSLVYSKKRKTVTCTYCGKIGGGSNMTRYHFNNCKNKV